MLRFTQFLMILCIACPLMAQQSYMQASQKLYFNGKYSDAYKAFNEVYELYQYEEALNWANKCVVRLHDKIQLTDSLIRTTKALTDQFYFYDNRLAALPKLGYFVDRNGNEVPSMNGERVFPFNQKTGYAIVSDELGTHWLNPDGGRYSFPMKISELPKVVSRPLKAVSTPQFKVDSSFLQYLNKYIVQTPTTLVQQSFNKGILLFNQHQFWEAYQVFKSINNMQDSIVSLEIFPLLKTACVSVMGNEYDFKKKKLERLAILKKYYAPNYKDGEYIESIVYYTFKNGSYRFINEQGNVIPELGQWDYIETATRDFWLVWKDGKKYYLDEKGQTFRVAFSLAELNEEITALDLSMADYIARRDISFKLKEFPKKILESPQLKILILEEGFMSYQDFADNNLPVPLVIPKEISVLQNLEYLALLNTGLKEIPLEFGQLFKLRHITILGSVISQLPDEFCQLKKLKHLNISSTNIEKLPNDFGQLQELKTLKLRHANIINLPSSFPALTQLEVLDLEGNKLLQLPNLSSFQKLNTLNLTNNQLTILPESIGACLLLKNLQLAKNQLSQLPYSLKHLKQLKILNLKDNQLSTFPIEEQIWYSLHDLKLIGNRIPNKALNSLFLTTPNLIELSFEVIDINQLPENLFLLRKLKKLDLFKISQLSIDIRIRLAILLYDK